MNLLLVVGLGFAVLVVGTLLGRFYTPDRRPLVRAAEEGRSYARSLLEVLEGNNDQAISQIVDAIKKNTSTAEAYFALGTLFRGRGEYERAVRVHQTLLVRRDLDKKTRLGAHFQLALDFKAAGFPRRAVKAMEYVVAQDKRRLPALRALVELYEAAGELERAVLVHRRIAKLTGEDTRGIQAHLLAELAGQALEEDDLGSARRHLKRALSARGDSVHALHHLARYHDSKGNKVGALEAWEKALRAAPDLAAFFAPRLETVAFDLDRLGAFERLLQELLDADPSNAHLRLAYARFDAKRNPERALADLTDLLETAPALMVARQAAARLILEQGDPGRIREALEELTATLAEIERGYRCARCGHAEEALFWRCPGCRSWDSVRVAWGRRSGEDPDARKRDTRPDADRVG
jgi:lipopolysaccharide biosynthesis regulator YciM